MLVEVDDEEVVFLVFVLEMFIDEIVLFEVVSGGVFWMFFIEEFGEFIISLGYDDFWFFVELLKFVVVDRVGENGKEVLLGVLRVLVEIKLEVSR